MKATIGHIGINSSSEEASSPFWGALLTDSEFTLNSDSPLIGQQNFSGSKAIRLVTESLGK